MCDFGISLLMSITRDVTSQRELWEGNGNGHSHKSDKVMGMGREPGIFLQKNFMAPAGNLFFENR